MIVPDSCKFCGKVRGKPDETVRAVRCAHRYLPRAGTEEWRAFLRKELFGSLWLDFGEEEANALLDQFEEAVTQTTYTIWPPQEKD